MIRINVYAVADQTVVQIHYLDLVSGTKARPAPVVYLHLSQHPQLAHDETGMLAEWISDALVASEERVAGLGFWSALV